MTALASWAQRGVAVAGLMLAALIVQQAGNLYLVVVIVTVAVGPLVIWIAIEDLRFYTISDSAILTVAIVASAYRWSASISYGESAIAVCMSTGLDALLPGGVLLLFREIYYRRKGFDGLGLGDVKLAAAGGILVGAVGFSWALLVSSILALAFVGVSQVKQFGRPLAGCDKVAFGALLAPALWAVWVAEQFSPLLPYPNL